jgi:monothiol glutaredoxin
MSITPELQARIQGIVDSSPCVLFMKGNPVAPQCGFSAQVVQVLNRLLPEYQTFDVLSDGEVREGVKEFSDWPTIPQLYVGGEFMGGSDIVKEMYDSGELHDALGMERPVLTGDQVAISISADAEQILRNAQQQQEAELHFGIDAKFQPFLGFGPATGSELRVPVGGLSFLLDRDSAVRAQGASITVVESEHGQRLDIDIPAARVAG